MNASRFDREIASNKDALKAIANAVNRQLRVKLDKSQLTDLLQFVRGQRVKAWAGAPIQDICMKIANAFVSSRFTEAGRQNLDPELVDIHEIMKTHLGTNDQEVDYEMAVNVDDMGKPIVTDVAGASAGASAGAAGALTELNTIKTVDRVAAIGNISGFLGKTDEVSIQQMFNPQAAQRKNYIILDSRYRDTSQDVSSSGFSSMSWVFLANSANTTAGGVNSLGNVEQVVSMATGDIRIPYQNNAMINSYRRISMNIKEWSGQSFIGQEGCKFHFMFKASIDGNMIDCTALSDSTVRFEFAKPITQLDRITVTFGCPLEPITFDMDRQSMQVTYSAAARFTSTYAHNLQTGDQVYISGFTTGDVTTDNAVITRVNNPVGYNVVVLNTLEIEIPNLDLTTVTAPITPFAVTVYFGSKRIFVPLELTYIAKSQSR